MDIYAPRFDLTVIYDYSTQALEQAQKSADSHGYTSIETKQGDAYSLPFEDNSFDVIIMVRVLHHIDQPELLFSEITRILKPQGTFIIDIPNKIHLKNRLTQLMHGNPSFYKDETPQQIGISTVNNEEGIFINYHPKHIIDLLNKKGFSVVQKKSILNARLPLLKKIFSTNFLVALDMLLQPLFTPDYLGPQIWITCKLTSK